MVIEEKEINQNFQNSGQKLPLSGIRILELGHYIAAPFCTRLLADIGAEIIKVERPALGDPIRGWGETGWGETGWGEMINGKSVWWSVHGRNKKSITLNLKHASAREIILNLIKFCHAIVENFRPGQLERLGLSDKVLKQKNPNLVITHISGYGQTGPHCDKAAFGVIGEALGGLRYITNHPPTESNLPPVRVEVSIGDSIAGLYAAFGTVVALFSQTKSTRYSFVDVALTEAVF